MEKIYGTLEDGRQAHLFTLTNKNSMEVQVTNFGAILVSVRVPDQNGNISNVTLGFDHLDGWIQDPHYLGASVGRFGNRIAHGKFSLDGEDYSLVTNNDPAGIPCHLHGGSTGFNSVLWDAEFIPNGVKFTYTSADGEEGYPGEVQAAITYLLNDDNELTWQATATTSKATPINLVQHTYWNLSGNPENTILDHVVQLNADCYLPTNPGMIPTGERKPVSGTPMDFLQPTPVGSRIEDDYESLQLGFGYDHAWVINGEGLRHAATVRDPKSGRTLEVHTDQPAVQFYTGNFLGDSPTGKSEVPYIKRAGLCLETEGFPDAPNQPDFPNCILRPGETYQHTMVSKFSW